MIFQLFCLYLVQLHCYIPKLIEMPYLSIFLISSPDIERSPGALLSVSVLMVLQTSVIKLKGKPGKV